MRSHRRYVFQHPGEWTHGGHMTVLTVMQRHCDLHWWFSEPFVEGEPYNRLSFGLTVVARDQWWCHRRAMEVAYDCYYAIGQPESAVPAPMWEPLAPHTNRGRHRIPVTPSVD